MRTAPVIFIAKKWNLAVLFSLSITLSQTGCNSKVNQPAEQPSGTSQIEQKISQSELKPEKKTYEPLPATVTLKPTTPFVYGKAWDGPKKLELMLPQWPSTSIAVWGALGRDEFGRILVGASVDAAKDSAAHLLSFDPSNDTWSDLGDPVSKLKKITPDKPVSQNKLHTRFWHAGDGYVYFASMDEGGEVDDGSTLPIYGSHLWRVKVNDISSPLAASGVKEWEHLKFVPEGVIVSAMGGNSIFFMGYFDHVVYRVNLKTQKITSTRIGATGGHVSRNMLADSRGHLFVPRVRQGQASIVELNEELDEVNSTPLKDYDVSPNSDSHGIISFAYLKDGSIFFMTDLGRLYRIEKGIVSDYGMVSPNGKGYYCCMTCPDGEGDLHLIGHPPLKGEREYEWIVYNWKTKQAKLSAMTVPTPPNGRNILIYGSMTMDSQGRWYLGGAYTLPGSRGFIPAMWRSE